MVQEQIIARGITDEKTIQVMSELPRHCFVDDALKSQAYIDAPLNIGEGQTISQPYIVALMTEALKLTGNEKVLEIGTGCGYQTVILARLAKQVYTVERIKFLALKSRQRFKNFELKNIVLRIGDGSLGWKESAPFDRILVTCAAPGIVDTLALQLAENGIMVIPVAAGEDLQNLMCMRKTGQTFETQNLGGCRFVKLFGKYGYQD